MYKSAKENPSDKWGHGGFLELYPDGEKMLPRKEENNAIDDEPQKGKHRHKKSEKRRKRKNQKRENTKTPALNLRQAQTNLPLLQIRKQLLLKMRNSLNMVILVKKNLKDQNIKKEDLNEIN